MYQYLLFDLDGTLTDPKERITKSVQHALKHFGVEEDDLDQLEVYIGPPLKEGFMENHGFSEEQALEAVKKYRERFSVTGLYENAVFEGVENMLSDLQAKGKTLAVASSKPEVFVNKILKHYHLNQYFDEIVGSELDGTRSAKTDVIKEAMRRLQIKPEEKRRTIMVGDRKHDIEGAKRCKIPSIGVTFGYGGEAELSAAGADKLAFSIESLSEVLSE